MPPDPPSQRTGRPDPHAPDGQSAHPESPATSSVVLLLLDVINDLEWQGGESILPHFERVAGNIEALAARARAAGVPVVYVNDNYGQWRSDFRRLVAHSLGDVRGRHITERLRPQPDDYFILKPKHSGFFSTTLETLLNYLGARTLVLAGIAGNICVLFTASDAYMRDFKLVVPSDCVASNTEEANRQALHLMAEVLGADIRRSTQIDLRELRAVEPAARFDAGPQKGITHESRAASGL